MFSRVSAAILSSFFLILATTGSTAGASESDKFCLYLGGLANKAAQDDATRAEDPSVDIGTKMKEVMGMARQTNELLATTEPAVAQRLTFEQYRRQMAEMGKEVSLMYKSLYIGKYIRTYCGSPTSTTSFAVKNGEVTKYEQSVQFPKQFDPTAHPYYQDMRIDASGSK